MKVALATPRVVISLEDALTRIERFIIEAAQRGAEIVCFPEAYVPGLRGMDFGVVEFDAKQQSAVVNEVAEMSRTNGISVVLGTETFSSAGRSIAAVVLNADGKLIGVQTKNQLDPSEEAHYVPGHGRQLFEVNGVKFGVVICHEGFRYPETVRWAASRGAKLVFHPHCTGSDQHGTRLERWGSEIAPYYERAIMCRALENTIFVASVNYAFDFQESSTCVISPSGECMSYLPYGEEGVLVQEIDTTAATGLIASRFAPERYG